MTDPREGAATRLQAAGIIAAALEVMNDAGLDALTMRRLAGRLGVQAPALYWHFRNKQALLDAMLDTLLAGTLEAPAAGEAADAWLSRVGRRLRQSLVRYRDAARLVTQVQLTPRMIEVQLPRFYEGFQRLGIEGRDVLYTSIALVAFVVGWVQTEQNMHGIAVADGDGIALGNGDGDAPHGQQWLRLSGALPAPPGFAPLDLEAAFEHGLALMIDGCRALAARAGTG